MAYSQSPTTLERMLPFLAPLAEGRETTWQTPPNRARWFAYKVREALAVAAQYPERFPELAKHSFRIEVLGDREVCARLRAPSALEEITQAPSTLGAPSAATPEQIVAAWQEGRTAGKLYFPDAGLSTAELLWLHEWSQETGVLLFESAGAITLLPLEGNEELAAYTWTPGEAHEQAD